MKLSTHAVTQTEELLCTKQRKNGRIRSVCHVSLVVYFQDWRLVISTQ